MTTPVSVADVQNAIKQAIIDAGALAAGASGVYWNDEQRGAGKTCLILDTLYWQHLQDRSAYTESSPGVWTWALSTLYYIRIQVRAESIFNAPGSDALFIAEKVRAGLRRPDLTFGAEMIYQPDTNTYMHHVSYVNQSRTVSSWSFEAGFRAVVDFPLSGPEEAPPNMLQVLIEGDVDPGTGTTIDMDSTVDRPL